MKLDNRNERNTRSVISLKDFLKEIIDNPADFVENTAVFNALKSQGGMSKLCDVQRNIIGTSLNTVKRIYKKTFQEDFKILDLLRITAYESIELHKSKKISSNKITKSGLLKRVKELEQTILLRDEDMLCITLALEKSLTQGRYYAIKSENPTLIALCTKEQREIRIMMSLLKDQPTKA